MKMNTQQCKIFRTQGSTEREVHSNKGLPEEMEKSQINNLTLHLQKLEEQQQQRKPRASGK